MLKCPDDLPEKPWVNGEPVIEIQRGEVHLWFVDDEAIIKPELLESYHPVMADEETDRHRRFHFKQHRHQYLITRALVRFALSYYTKGKMSPNQWVFRKNQYGKPFVSNAGISGRISFNLSHCEKMIVLAITSGQDVGVDVEYLLRDGATVDLAEHYFSSLEVEHLHRLPCLQQDDRFYDLWTLKEAYIKACGGGMSIPLDHFSFSFDDSSQLSISFDPRRDDDPEHWQFWQISPNPTHKVAVALKEETGAKPCSLHMFNVVPIKQIKPVDYPVFRKTKN